MLSLGIIIDFVAGFTHSGGLLYPGFEFTGFGFLVFEFLESGFWFYILDNWAKGGVKGLLLFSIVSLTGRPPVIGI